MREKKPRKGYVFQVCTGAECADREKGIKITENGKMVSKWL